MNRTGFLGHPITLGLGLGLTDKGTDISALEYDYEMELDNFAIHPIVITPPLPSVNAVT